MLVMIWRVESPSAVRMQAREGEFHGLTSTEIALQEAGGGALEDRVLLRERRYHSSFSKP
jgi:hypothetical protein